MNKIAVVAIGGNSITKSHQIGTIPEQFENTRETSVHLVDMIKQGYTIVIAHGNGPQVGNILRRVEEAAHVLYTLPLDTCVADSQGGMGYMIQQVLKNELSKAGLSKDIATIITQVVVDKDDPAFESPSKPIGQFFDKERATQMKEERGWDIVEDAGRGYRRVVPSPLPKYIVEKDIIKHLVALDNIVIAVGGGGIPVIEDKKGIISGVEAVIDKDRASSVLAKDLNAELFLISTDVENVYINFNTPEQKSLGTITIAEAKNYLAEGHFAKGSMAPKIEAACQFIENGGKKAIITCPECIGKALNGETGTHIVASL